MPKKIIDSAYNDSYASGMLLKRQRKGYRTLKISVCLTREEHAALKAICTEERITRSMLLEAFIADATQSSRCVTPNFDWWLEQRGFSHPELICYGRYETPATTHPSEIDRRNQWLLRWQKKALAERVSEGGGNSFESVVRD